MQQIAEADLHDLAFGASVLGAGGGGSPHVGRLLAAEAIRRYGPVDLVDCDDVPDEALVVSPAGIGAPAVLNEKLPAGTEITAAFEALQKSIGRTITHVLCIEVGGVNSMFPIVVAAQRRLPVVDADLMGRAFPELQMCLPTLFGGRATPLALADEKDNTIVLDMEDNLQAERIARLATVELGCQLMLAAYPLTGRDLPTMSVAGTLTLSREIGRVVREARDTHEDPTEALRARMSAVRLFSGKLVDVDRAIAGGFTTATTRIDGFDADVGSQLVVHSQNEHLIAFREGKVVATVPDLIIILDVVTAEPITTEDLRYGLRVTVLVAPCDPRWRSDAGLQLVGPRYFGYDIDYLPIERQTAARS